MIKASILAFFILIGSILSAFAYPDYLTETEIEWLEQHKNSIKLAPDSAFEPFEYIDEKGTYQGIASDYIRLIEESLDLNFEIIKVATWKENVELMNSRKLDVWGAAAKTPQRSKFMNFSIPYYQLNTIILVPTDNTGEYRLSRKSGDRIAVMNGYYTHDYLKSNYDNNDIVTFDSAEAALIALSKKEVDAMLTDIATASYYLNKIGIKNIKNGGTVDLKSAKLSIAVRNDWPILIGIIDKAISRISPETHKRIVRKWVRMDVAEKNPINYLKKYNLMGIAAAILLVTVLGFLIFRFQNKQLNKIDSKQKMIALLICGVLLFLTLWFVYNEVQSAKHSLHLTSEEKLWLKDHPHLKIAPDYSFAPIEFMDAGQFKGIAADYVELIQKALAYDFEIVEIQKWSDNVISAKSRGHDIWSAVAPTVQKQEYMLFTEPYLEIISVLVVPQDDTRVYDFNDMGNRVIAVVDGYFTQDYMKKNYQNVLLKPFPNALAGLRAVAFKEVDAMFIDVATASYLIEEAGFTTLKAVSSIDTDYQLSFASRKDMPMLNQILDKALKSITPEERKTIYQKWISFSANNKMSYKEMYPIIALFLLVGAVIFVLFIFLNRSLRKMVSEKTKQLSESEQFRRQLFNLAGDPMVIYNDKVIVDCNDRFLDLFQMTRESAIGENIGSLYRLHQPDKSVSAEKMESMIDGVLKGAIQSFEWQFLRADDTDLVTEVSLNEIILGGKDFIQLIIRDITDRKLQEYNKQLQIERVQGQQQAIAALSTSEAIHSDNLSDIFKLFTSVICDVLQVERVCIWMFNKEMTALESKSIYLLSIKDHVEGETIDIQDCPEFVRAISSGLPLVAYDAVNDSRITELKNKYLIPHDIHSLMNIGITVSGKVHGIICVEETTDKRTWFDDEVAFISSISELLAQAYTNLKRLEAEAQLRSTREYVKHIVDFMPSMIIGVDAEFRVTQWNLQAEKITHLNVNSVIGKQLTEVLPKLSENIKYVEMAIKENITQYIHHFLTYLEGEPKYYNVTIYPINILSVTKAVIRIDDVTENEKKDAQLRQSQKMEMVGTLAGGLAHDFNNVLGGIVGTVSIMKMKLKKDGIISEEALEGYLETIDKSGDRASNMVKQLLTVSRKQDISMVPIDLNNAVVNVIDICKNTFDKSIHIYTEYPEEPVVVNADNSQIEQVILNFCVNASHAMTMMRESSDKWGGTLKVSILKIYPDKHFLSMHPEANDHDYVVVTVEDTGVGMTQDVISKIFTPFFTLKGQGAGTGLGLSMVYSIVKEHNGFLDVNSEHGVGSTFRLYLPLFHNDFKQSIENTDRDSDPLSGEGVIMVVDDEEIIRMTASEILKECGYTVICVESGSEAVDVFRLRKGEIRAVILDMAMPELSGKDTYLLLKEIQPDVKVLLASGFKLDERVEEVLQLGVKGFIQKPYSFESLHNSLNEIL